jgi:hypothetical protein
VSDGVFLLAALTLAVLLGLRVLRYLPLDLPDRLDGWLGQALVVSWLLFIFPLLLLPKHLAALALLAAMLAVRPGLFARREEGRWRLRPWFHAFLWLELALNHALLDLNPYLALVLAFGLAATELDGRWPAASGRGFAAVVGALIVTFAALSDTWADAVAALVFGVLLAALLRVGGRAFGSRERRLLVIAAGIACQLLAAFLPLALPWHGGSKLGEGMAYSFCEAPRHRAVFAAVPRTPTMLPWSRGGRHGEGGYVAEYRIPELLPAGQHRFFSSEFYGRLEWLTCLPDAVQVGMTNTFYRGRQDQDHAMEFSIADPRQFTPDLLHGGAGHGIAYDEKRDALYYVSENKGTLVRVDRATGQRETILSDALQGKPFHSLIVGPRSIHRERDSLFLVGWFNGTHAYELDLETRAIVREYPHRDGGALGVTVDEERDRLYVVGVWGMEVFDIPTGKVLLRKRLGLLSRSPAIDLENDLVYVPATVEGKIRVFDRKTLVSLGAIAVGHGPRIPLFSERQGRLFSSSSLAHYYWDGAMLASRFRKKR